MPRNKVAGPPVSCLDLTRFATWILGYLVAVAHGAAPPDLRARHFTGSDARLDEIITWLPEDTASIIVARRARCVPSRNSDSESAEKHSESNAPKTGFRECPAGRATHKRAHRLETTTQGPREPGDGPTIFSRLGPSYAAFLERHPPCLAVRALRRSTAVHTTKQRSPHDALEVLAFSADVDVGDVMLIAARKGTTQQIEGKKIIAFEADEKTYFSSPEPNVLIATTTVDCLQTVLERLTSTREVRRPLPRDLLEWKHVDTDADIWGLHHVVREKPDVGKPMTSVGLTFWYKDDDTRQITVRCVSSGDNGKDEFATLIERLTGKAPSLRAIAPGVDEANLPADTAAWFLVELMMGYPVCP